VEYCAYGNYVSIVSVQDMVSYGDGRRPSKYDFSFPALLIREVELVGYVLRVYGHFNLNQYNPYVVMQAFTVSIWCGPNLSRFSRRLCLQRQIMLSLDVCCITDI
jgi:hypothetical protein